MPRPHLFVRRYALSSNNRDYLADRGRVFHLILPLTAPICPAILTPYFIDKGSGHRDRLYKQLEQHVQNHLPIHLLRLEDITLVHRSAVQNQMRLKIEANDLDCDEDECECFEELKNDMNFAILSHRWGPDELSFQDLSDTTKPAWGASGTLIRRTLEKARSKSGKGILQRLQEAGSKMPADSGFTKLVKLCEIAVKEDCKFAWLDTVCINKESSAELDESIRSMFGWYRDSHICIAHLAQTMAWNDMLKDQWFKRGWTLQELLAPSSIIFFSSDWKRLTDRRNDKEMDDEEEESPPLMMVISKITNIPIEDLINFKPGLHDIEKRMSWASKRETTRVEDKAYSLIGIFGISLSVAYGERDAAFYRLQVEILQRSGDRSLFHWKGEASAQNSMLAAGPECFNPIIFDAEFPRDAIPLSDPTYTLTNIGLRMRLKTYHPKEKELQSVMMQDGTVIAILAETAGTGKCLALELEKIGTSESQHYKRTGLVNLNLPSSVELNKAPVEIFIA